MKQDTKENIRLHKCPACGYDKFTEFIRCKDHFLSGEEFTIVKCQRCGLKFTNPRPADNELFAYYKSENYISHSNSRKGLMNKIYHWARSRNLKNKFKLINDYKKSGRILDIGCATGEFLAHFSSKGWAVSGIEPDRDARAYAIATHNINVLPEEQINELGNNNFDVITLWHVLEHVPQLQQRIKELQVLLRNDGFLFIAVPNSASYDADYYQDNWAGYDVPRHLYHFDKDTLIRLFAAHGFECMKIVPMKYDAYYVSMLSEKYKKSAFRSLKAAFIGFASNRKARSSEMNYSSLIFVFKKANESFLKPIFEKT